MKKGNTLALTALLVATLCVGAFQSHRLGKIDDSEKFYRWMLAEGLNLQLTGGRISDDVEGSAVDRALFTEIAELLDSVLPDEPLSIDDMALLEKGELRSKLVRWIRDAKLDNDHDKVLWQLATGDELVKQKADFGQYLLDDKIALVPGGLTVAQIQDAEVNVANLFFGFRMLAANFVWLQVDRFWHEGNTHRMLPLMWTSVALDPNFIDAYLVGAWHLAYNITAKMKDTPDAQKVWNPKYKVRIGDKEKYYYIATDFLKTGIRSNPRSYKLYFDLGFAVYELKIKDHANASLYLTEAIRYKHDKWVPRMRNLCLRRNGQYEDAIRGWEAYTKVFPDNTYAPRQIPVNMGFIEERDGRAASERASAADAEAVKAREAGDDAKADELEYEAAEARSEMLTHYDGARRIWSELDPEGGDTLAVSRLLYLDAMEYREQKRYHEAVAKLDQARYACNEFFYDFSDIIIDVKLEAGFPLLLTERMALIRRQEAEKALSEFEAKTEAETETEE